MVSNKIWELLSDTYKRKSSLTDWKMRPLAKRLIFVSRQRLQNCTEYEFGYRNKEIEFQGAVIKRFTLCTGVIVKVLCLSYSDALY